jgi:S1-C subfamily serine protease
LDISKRHGLRLTPLMQFGHISGFLPTDEAWYPYALQTDIIGTGGSSGSPIVDPYDGKVVGISQNVIISSISGIGKGFFSIIGETKIKKIFKALLK